MKLASFLLLATVLPVATLAAQLPAYGAPEQAAASAGADASVAAAQAALDAAEKALANAEETGGDIRAARRSLANAMKSLRAAEAATGTAPAPAAPAVRPAQPNPSPATPTTPAPSRAPVAPIVPAPPGPQPYQPPAPPTATPAKPAPANPAPAAPAPAKPAPPARPAETRAPTNPANPGAPVVIRRGGGQTETRTREPNGITVVTITDRRNRLVRRIEIAPNGAETVTFDRERRRAEPRMPAEPVQPPRIYDPREVPPPPGMVDPREVPPPSVYEGRAGLDGGNASEAEIERTLRGRPIGPGGGGYTLNEIRRSERLRGRVAAVDLDTITFESGSARVPDDQVWKLERIATALGRVLDRWPGQVFLIEGHTDAIGTRLANQELSDRRAASVAGILNRYFGIPRQSLVTEGYGEDYLKVPTEGPSRQNRRVTIRNITPLLGR